MEAVEAFIFLIPDKIKKFARVAKAIARIINGQFVFVETNASFMPLLPKRMNGNMIIAARIESINKSGRGATPERIF